VHRTVLALMIAGAAGAASRYAVAGLVQHWSGHRFPAGTLAVNVAGCFLAGLLWTLAQGRLQWPAELRTAVLIGFLGSFTTFSSYMLETGLLVRQSRWLMAAGNVLLQNVVGFAALAGGIIVARLL